MLSGTKASREDGVGVADRIEVGRLKSAASLMHLMNASSAQISVIEDKGTGTMVREMRPLQDQDSSFFPFRRTR
jgi:hypothetical protein